MVLKIVTGAVGEDVQNSSGSPKIAVGQLTTLSTARNR